MPAVSRVRVRCPNNPISTRAAERADDLVHTGHVLRGCGRAIAVDDTDHPDMRMP
ncbi:hypothetical protein [Rhodococcus koreensis]|uniref:hypothetical protein n=1 Tax=Rhodococcus koreensis TaxID=99653 RepID=UPI00366D5A7E